MNDNDEDELTVQELAADWLERQQELSEAEFAAFCAWLRASQEHARVYANLRKTMLDSALLDACEAVNKPMPVAPPRRMISARRLGWIGTGLAIAAAIMVMLVMRAPAPVAPPQDFATGLRQRADWKLADNSHLFLNADSRISVRYLPDARNLSLARGEAIFEVAKDPRRPFHVMARSVTVTAVGTLFGVDLMNDAVGVRVYHGVVTVAKADGETRTLTKGDWLTLDPRLGAHAGRFDPAVYQNWRTDWLEADKMPLSYVVAKLNHYTGTPIVISDPSLAGAVISGRFQLSNTDATLRLIAAVLNLQPARRDHRVYLTAHRS